MNNAQISTIQAIYAAFARADAPAILAQLTADVRFSFAGGSKQVPWHGPWQGPKDAGRFFGSLAEAVELETFEPLSFSSGPDCVAVRLHLRYRVRRTTRIVDQEQVHWWTLRDGKVASLTHFEDTAQVLAAVL